MRQRILDPADIPASLYGADGIIVFPGSLAGAYRDVLQNRGLLGRADSATHDGSVGGATAADTANHFISAFSGSCARSKLAVLDPKGQLQDASDLFMRAFSGGRVALLDAPCGAGAASAALLATVAELRRHEVIPRLPLEVRLVGGDISHEALSYSADVLEGMRDALHKQGITINAIFRHWNLLDEVSNTQLLHDWMVHAPDCREHFLLVANFSGFLQSGGNFKEGQQRLEELFRWAAVRRSTVAWLEPQTNAALVAMWPKVIKRLFSKTLSLFGAANTTELEAGPLLTEARFQHPLRSDRVHPVRLSLVRMTRNAG